MGDKENVQERQEAIKKLLSEALISDQKTLVDLLHRRFGIETNQSVLSRDLRRLGVTKKEIQQELFYVLPDFDVIAEILRLAIVDINFNEAMIVVKTHPGLAAFVGDYIDKLALADILGCLAGENVVFITCQSIKKNQAVFEVLCQKLHLKKIFL